SGPYRILKMEGNDTPPPSATGLLAMTNPSADNPMPRAEPTARSGYDAILIVGFGGPERREDVLPFLENVTRGRNVPRGRLLEVAAHYDHFGGVSPSNAQVRGFIGAPRSELSRQDIS